MLLLDTSRYPVNDRTEIVRGILGELAGSTVEPAGAETPIQVRLQAWDVGDGCCLFHVQGSGLRVRRLPSRLSSPGIRSVSFSVQPSGQARFSQNGRHELVPGGGMFLAEMSEAYTYEFTESGDAVTLQIPLDILDVPLCDVRRAARRLTLSPVYELARHHLLALSRYTEAFDVPQPSAQQAMLHVFRALVKSFGSE